MFLGISYDDWFKACALGAGTLFWLWYLPYEIRQRRREVEIKLRKQRARKLGHESSHVTCKCHD